MIKQVRAEYIEKCNALEKDQLCGFKTWEEYYKYFLDEKRKNNEKDELDELINLWLGV